MSRTYRQILAPWGLSYTQYLVLTVLWGGGSLTVSALGSLLGLDSGTLSPLVKRLEQRGLILRRRSTEDERVVEVVLTEEGDALRSISPEIQKCLAESLSMEPDEFLRLLDGVKAFNSHFEE